MRFVGEQVDGNLSEHCTQILDTWLQMSDQADDSAGGSTQTAITGFDSAIHNLIAKQTEGAVVRKPVDADDAERKKAILAQYAHLSDGEEYPFVHCSAFVHHWREIVRKG